MLSLYSDHPTWLHRVPPGLKLAVLAVGGIVLFALQGWPPLGVACLLSLLLMASLGPPARAALRMLRPIVIASLLLLGLHALLGQAMVGVTSALRLVTAATLGAMLTLTTTHGQLLDTLERLLAPLARRGLPVERLALQLGLMLRFVEHFFAQWRRLDDAHRARSGRAGGWRLLAPLTIRMLETSRRVADALQVRGRR